MAPRGAKFVFRNLICEATKKNLRWHSALVSLSVMENFAVVNRINPEPPPTSR